jgi:L,D-transpeptidase catalytic domain/Sporulation and spore germination/Putative peptidoglycan binding domain
MPASTTTSTVKVWFLQGEQLVSVTRPGSSPQGAIQALLKGPTPAEYALGFRTYIPAATTLRAVTIANGLVTVDLSLPFALGNDAQSLDARLSQLVHTATGFDGVSKIQLLVNGGIVYGMFPGIVTALPITLQHLETPTVPAWRAVSAAPGPAVTGLLAAQQRLVSLGFLLPGDANGQDGPQTQTAVLAFQKWEGLTRDGVLGPQTMGGLRTATRPQPITRGGPGKRAEVLLDRQVVLAINNNQVVRVIPVSTGKPSTPTPTGNFKVYAKFAKWWSTPFQEWLLWAVPFNGGVAFHYFPEVPPYAASHGCVRQMATTAKWLYDFSYIGMPVKVIATS